MELEKLELQIDAKVSEKKFDFFLAFRSQIRHNAFCNSKNEVEKIEKGEENEEYASVDN
jgi:ABC-type molybdate transport system substrate-binding protein